MRCVSFAALCAIAVPASAGPAIADFSNFKTRVAVQTDSGFPNSPDTFFVQQRFFGSGVTAGAVGTASVSSAGTGSREMTIIDNVGAFVFSPLYGSEGEMDAFLPGEDYTFAITGGTLGDGSGVITQPAFNPWSSQPFVTNWDDLQDAEPGVDLLVTFETPTLDPEASEGGVFWSLRAGGVEVQFGFQGFADPAEFVMSGGGLSPNTTYELSVTFSARTASTSGIGSLQDIPGFVAFDTITRTTFTTVPAPGALGLLSLFALAARRRRA